MKLTPQNGEQFVDLIVVKMFKSNTMQQITTLTFFRYKGFFNRVWGMSMMGRIYSVMPKNKSVLFFKPLGTGGGSGYSIVPDFGVYGLLTVWRDISDAEDFLKSALYNQSVAHSTEQYTLFLKAIHTKGSWSGFSGWEINTESSDVEAIATLSRASIRPGFLIPFWRMTPRVSKELKETKGLIFTKGIGELPLMEQATFSIWENKEALRFFALNTYHGETMEITRDKEGFSEEMFTRFRPLKAVGTWNGENPIEKLLQSKEAE